MPESSHKEVKSRRHAAAKIDAPKPRVMGGMTLIELTVVLLILVALAGVTIPMFTNTPRDAQCVATDATMANIRDAIMGSGGMAGYRSDMGVWPNSDSSTASSLTDLFNNPLYTGANNPTFNQQPNPLITSSNSNPTTQSFNPTTQRGWRGPYISGGMTCASIAGKISGYNQTIDKKQVCNFSGTPINPYTVALDSFPAFGTNTATGDTTIILQGSPIVLMQETTSSTPNGNYFLVSGGPTGGILIDPANMACRNSNAGCNGSTAASSNDDRVLYLNSVDPGSNQPCS